MIGGLTEAAQSLFLQCAQAIFQQGVPSFVTEAGTPLPVTVTADLASTPVVAPVVHVGIEQGSLRLGGPGGRVGRDATNQYALYRVDLCNAAAVFTVYSATDMERRWLIDWVPWGLLTAYTVDTYGITYDAYLLTFLRQWQIFVSQTAFADAPVFAPEDLREGRPFGLPFRASLRIHFDQQLIWTMPLGAISNAQVVLTPNGGPPLVGPIVIPVPNTFPPAS